MKKTRKHPSQQQPLVDASDSGGFCLNIFFLTPAEPSAKRLGVSRICKTKIHRHNQEMFLFDREGK